VLDLRLSRRLALLGTLAADLDVTGQRYVFRRASGEDAVLSPWIVRPAAALGLAFP
jgi:putative intracellular protease/amidase